MNIHVLTLRMIAKNTADLPTQNALNSAADEIDALVKAIKKTSDL